MKEREFLNGYENQFTFSITEKDVNEGYLCLYINAAGYYRKHFDVILDSCFKDSPITILLAPVLEGTSDLHFIPDNESDADIKAQFTRDSLINIEKHKYIKALPPCK